MTLTRFKDLSEAVLATLTAMGLLAGGAFALIEYLEYKERFRIETSLKFVSRFQEEHLLKSRHRLRRAWDDAYPHISAILRDKTVSQDAINRNYYLFVNSHIKQQQLQSDLEVIMEFLQEISYCVRVHLCEPDVITEFWGREGEDFFSIYYPYICELRRKWNDSSIGEEIEKLFLPTSSRSDLCPPI
jgi:hypothetical protein